MWRQGDVFIERIERLPRGARRLPHLVLAEGELTGHSHRIAEAGAAGLYQEDGALFLQVTADEATLVHQEHGPLSLTRGFYRVWRQREYQPKIDSRAADFYWVCD